MKAHYISLIEFKGIGEHLIVANPPERYVEHCQKALASNEEIEKVSKLIMCLPANAHHGEDRVRVILFIHRGDHVTEKYWIYGVNSISYVRDETNK